MRRAVPDVIHSTMGQANPGHLTQGKFYKFQGDPEWVPNDPRYREPETRRPGPPPGSPNSTEAKAGRFAAFCAARESGASVLDAGTAAGIAVKTARKYEQERRRQRGASRDDL